MQGVIIITLSILLSSSYDKYAKYINDKRLANMIHLFELMIMMEQYMKQKVLLRKSVLRLKTFMPMFLEHYKSCVNRSCKFLKFHLPLHLADDILGNGPPTGFDSSIGESNHKIIAKQTSRRTQKQSNVLDEQTSLQYVENIIIEKASQSIPNHSNSEKGTNEDDIEYVQGLSFVANKYGIFHVQKGKKITPANWTNKQLQLSVHHFICYYILNNVAVEELNIYTVVKAKGNIYQGNPKYKLYTWHDWNYIDWGENYRIIPNQIMCYIDLSSLQRTISINSTIVNRKGIYALIHMIEHPLDSDHDYKAHQDSRLFYWSQKMLLKPMPSNNQSTPNTTMIPMIGMAHIEAFIQPCVGIPANLPDKEAHIFLFLKPRKIWPIILDWFMNYTIERNKGTKCIEVKEKSPTYKPLPTGECQYLCI